MKAVSNSIFYVNFQDLNSVKYEWKGTHENTSIHITLQRKLASNFRSKPPSFLNTTGKNEWKLIGYDILMKIRAI